LTCFDPEFIPTALDIFNSYHPRIQFTTEFVVSRSVVIRTNDMRLKINWYSKKVSSNRLLNFMSKHPFSMKYNVALSFTRRNLDLSHMSFCHDSFFTIENLLLKKNILWLLIRKLFIKAKYSTPSRDQPQNSSIVDKPYSSLKYITGLTEKIKVKLSKNNGNLNFGLHYDYKTG
jgi:hypothetical protein